MIDRLVLFEISAELVADALKIPAGVKIEDIFRSLNGRNGVFTIKVSGDIFPGVVVGGKIPFVEPEIERVLWNWNLPEGAGDV